MMLTRRLLIILCVLVDQFHSTRVQNHVSSARYCSVCDLSFKKIVEFERHISGRRHQQQLARVPSRDQLWEEFTNGATSWSSNCLVEDVVPLWSDDELSSLGLKYRSTCLHPSPTISQLAPKQKARLWRYIRDVMGLSYYSEMASIMEAVDSDEQGHLRVKEVFESFEIYRKISSFITDAQKTLKSIDAPPIESIVELACGHGLVGALLAYRFHNLSIHLYDLHKRPTFEAFLRAFESRGIRRPGQSQVLPNIVFHETDMAGCVDQLPNSIVVCIHGCGQVNKRAIELAIDNGASGWIVLPCCIEKDMYLGHSCCVQLSDDTVRHVMLCGALANEYKAQLVDSIDSRITNRAVVIAGGIGRTDSKTSLETPSSYPTRDSTPHMLTNSEETDLSLALRRGRMPKLLRS